MTQEAISFVTPVGRIVWGSVSERATEDYDGKPYEHGKGPYQFGLAIRKDDPGLNDMLGKIYSQAMAGYSTAAHIQQRIQQEWQSGFAGLSFRFKIKDGDKPNAQGQYNENTKGCYVFALSTSLDLKACNAQNQQIDAREIERGYYADVHVSVKVNGNTDGTAGIYINPNVVRLVGFGEKIVGGIDIATAFGSAPAPALPPGASATPVAPAGAMLTLPPVGSGAPVAGPPMANPAVPPMPGLPTASPSSAPVQPHTAFVAGPPGLPGQ